MCYLCRVTLHWQWHRKEVFRSCQTLFFWAMDHFLHYLDCTKSLIVSCCIQPRAKAQDITAKTVVKCSPCTRHPFGSTTERKFEIQRNQTHLCLNKPQQKRAETAFLMLNQSQSRAAPTLLPFTTLVEQPKAHVLITLFLLLLLLLRLLFFRSFRCRGGPCTARGCDCCRRRAAPGTDVEKHVFYIFAFEGLFDL